MYFREKIKNWSNYSRYLTSILGILFYILILFLVWLAYVYFIKVNVVFYSALWAVLISFIIYIVIINISETLDGWSKFERLQHLISCLFLGYIIAITIPTIIDRSLSFYILEKLQQRGGSIQKSRINYIFTDEYIRESRLVDVRLTEQMESGTLIIDNDCVIITSKGDRIASFGNFFRNHLLPKKRLLMGMYTDELINPFSRSDSNPDYLCR